MTRPNQLLVMLIVFIFGYLVSPTYALDGADVVLSCSYVEEGGMMGGMGGGALFTRTPATLVLRNIPVPESDSALDSVTPFDPPDTPTADDLIFEAKGSSVEIPNANILLHADCNELEVNCEISRYIPRGSDPDAPATHFIGSLQVEGGGLSLTLVLEVLPNEETSSESPMLIQRKLELPLSQSGTLLTEVVFVVFSRSPSVSASLGSNARLDCGFRQQDTFAGELGLEWRIQHRGSGRKVLEMTTSEEGAPHVTPGREGSSVDPTLAVHEGNVSMSLMELRVADEGTYICTVTSGRFQTQQIVQLHITQPPTVSLSEEKVVFQDEPAQKITCHCRSYYPLDVQVEWLALISSEAEDEPVPVSISEWASLSSHRQHSDGTYSVTAHLMLRPTAHPPGTTITCRVSHQALGSDVDVSTTVLTFETGDNLYSLIISVLVVTIGTVIFYQVLGGGN